MATDGEGLEEQLANFGSDFGPPDAAAVLAGVFVLQLGSEMAYARAPTIIWGVVSVYVFGTAIGLIVAGVSDIDLEEYGRPIAAAAFIAIMSALGVTYLTIRGSPINTDALGFINTAASALLAGKSPYTVSMQHSGEFPTPMVGGGAVNSYSYPIGSALFVAPFRAVASDGARIAVLVSTVVLGGILIGSSPNEFAPLAFLSLLPGNFITWGVQDLTDPLWVAPLIAAIYLWPWSGVGRSSLTWSGVAFGIAMTMKQQAWFCSPFLMVWVAHDRGWRAAAKYVATVAGTFGLIHLPVALLDPGALATGLLTNLYGPDGTLVHLGVGLSALTLSGAFPIAKGAHTALMAVVGLGGVALYWRYFDTMRWTAWVAWGPILFVNYRSLANYFVVLAPVAVMIIIAKHGDSSAPEVADAAST